MQTQAQPLVTTDINENPSKLVSLLQAHAPRAQPSPAIHDHPGKIAKAVAKPATGRWREKLTLSATIEI
jgi:hypothetical protein